MNEQLLEQEPRDPTPGEGWRCPIGGARVSIVAVEEDEVVVATQAGQMRWKIWALKLWFRPCAEHPPLTKGGAT